MMREPCFRYIRFDHAQFINCGKDKVKVVDFREQKDVCKLS